MRPRPDALPEFHGTARHELHVAIRRLIAAVDRRAQQMLDAYWDDLERFAEELLREGAMEIRKDPEGQSEPA